MTSTQNDIIFPAESALIIRATVPRRSLTNPVTCYICGNDEERLGAEDDPRLVRYHRLVENGGRFRLRWARVIACWNCRETWADRIEEAPGR